ncbi:MAG: tyrosine-protein phosphatase [Gemmatimonadales bacterium]
MIDLHCHLLPGVDDGSRSIEQSLEVLREMARHGVTDVCLTPHLTATGANRGIPPLQDAAFDSLAPRLPASPAIHRGAEIMLDRALAESVARDRRATLGRTRYILVEFPRLVAENTVRRALSDTVAIGLRPVLAHPERYQCCSPAAVREWRSLGALMQVDATTLLSSRSRGMRARQLVEHGLADIAAADNHGDGRMLDAVHHVLDGRGGSAQAELLVRENPGRILRDEDTIPVPAIALGSSWWDRVRAHFQGEAT